MCIFLCSFKFKLQTIRTICWSISIQLLFCHSLVLDKVMQSGRFPVRSLMAIGTTSMEEITGYSTVAPNTTATVATTNTSWYYLIYIFTPLIFLFGIVGNTLTIVIMLKSSFSRLNVSVYLISLGVADTVCLFVFHLTRTFLDVVFEVYIDVISVVGCKCITYIHYSFSYISSWIIVAMTMERLYITLYPFKARTICTRKRALVIVILICSASLIINIFNLFAFDVFKDPDGYNYCEQINPQIQLITTLTDFVLYSLLPSIALLVANALLVYELNKRHDLRRSMTVLRDFEASSKKNNNTIFMLLTVSTTFVVLTTPASLYYVCLALFNFKVDDTIIMLRNVLQIMTSANHSVNFVLYCVSGPAFRKEMCRLCGSRKGKVEANVFCNSQRDETKSENSEVLGSSTTLSNGVYVTRF